MRSASTAAPIAGRAWVAVRQTIDTRTRQVVDQLPDRAMLGLRAYFERIAENSGLQSGGGDTHARVAGIQA